MDNRDYKKCDHGLVIVYTGNGKGKTTAALGLCIRGAGHGNKISIIQFIKSNWPYGELEGLKRLEPEVKIKTLGAGCIGLPGDNKPIEEHQAAAQKAYLRSLEVIEKNEDDTVVLDEINTAIGLELITVDELMRLLDKRPAKMNLVLTGRDAPKELIDRADLVTEMKEIKHPFQDGYLGKKGIDY
ncbi:MAG: cob(I)yrinic acid a,c-diamide adenosyltransferase [candidate division Zixibacteria bacterium]|nr:cob(I)yrinic acid a,c-diamide adenosyltransferase [candidate division Zixibacteria bacterium]